jgi:HJR/Mrr/RecB family endonuclease
MMHPEQIHEMTPRKFEQLVAALSPRALFRAKGYEVVLTPPTRDGGVDMRAFHRGAVGTFLTTIECKRYNPNKRISVDLVRGLYGVTESEGASLGLVVTTSSFTRDAKSFPDPEQVPDPTRRPSRLTNVAQRTPKTIDTVA